MNPLWERILGFLMQRDLSDLSLMTRFRIFQKKRTLRLSARRSPKLDEESMQTCHSLVLSCLQNHRRSFGGKLFASFSCLVTNPQWTILVGIMDLMKH